MGNRPNVLLRRVLSIEQRDVVRSRLVHGVIQRHGFSGLLGPSVLQLPRSFELLEVLVLVNPWAGLLCPLPKLPIRLVNLVRPRRPVVSALRSLHSAARVGPGAGLQRGRNSLLGFLENLRLGSDTGSDTSFDLTRW